MENEQHLLGDPQNNKSSENEEGVGSAVKKARRKRQTSARKKAGSIETQQSTGESSPQDNITRKPNQELQRPENEAQITHEEWQNAQRVGLIFVAPIPSPMGRERRSPQRRQGRRDQSPSPKKPS